MLNSRLCPSGEIGRRRGLRLNLSPLEETPEVKPVKLGEGPGLSIRANTEPSLVIERQEGVESRRRVPKAERLR